MKRVMGLLDENEEGDGIIRYRPEEGDGIIDKTEEGMGLLDKSEVGEGDGIIW